MLVRNGLILFVGYIFFFFSCFFFFLFFFYSFGSFFLFSLFIVLQKLLTSSPATRHRTDMSQHKNSQGDLHLKVTSLFYLSQVHAASSPMQFGLFPQSSKTQLQVQQVHGQTGRRRRRRSMDGQGQGLGGIVRTAAIISHLPRQ
jgi:hypothetical protein